LERALAGLAFGFGCAGVVQFCWLGLQTVVYGSLNAALAGMKPAADTQLAVGGYLAASVASFFGGLLAPLVLGNAPQTRRAILLSSAIGGALATYLAVLFGGLSGWVCWQVAPHSITFAWLALLLGAAAGIVGGWVGGNVVSRAQRGTAADRGRDSGPPG
jgi:hypothetical protein